MLCCQDDEQLSSMLGVVIANVWYMLENHHGLRVHRHTAEFPAHAESLML